VNEPQSTKITAQITGEPREIERLTRGSEGGRWKSTHRGNSLAAYPTACPVRVRVGMKPTVERQQGASFDSHRDNLTDTAGLSPGSPKRIRREFSILSPHYSSPAPP